MPDGRDKLKKLHSTLVSQGYDLPDYAVFEKDMEDGGKMERLRQTLVNDKYDMPDSLTFRSDMGFNGVKKKELGSLLGGMAGNGLSQSNGKVSENGKLAQGVDVGSAFPQATPEQKASFDIEEFNSLLAKRDKLNKQKAPQEFNVLSYKAGLKEKNPDYTRYKAELDDLNRQIEDKNQKVSKHLGIDADVADEVVQDFPNETNPNTLRQRADLRENNPIQYQRISAAHQNQQKIAEVAGNHVANQYNDLNEHGGTYFGLVTNLPEQLDIIEQNLTGKEREKAIENLRISTGQNLNATVPEIQQEYEQSGLKEKGVDADQYAGLLTLKYFNPKKYQQALKFINQPIENIYEHYVDFTAGAPVPGGLGVSHTIENTNEVGGTLSQKTIAQQTQQEQTLHDLLSIGRNNAKDYLIEHNNSLNKAYGEAQTPEQQEAIAARSLQNVAALKSIQQDESGDAERFPLQHQMQLDQMAKELTQDKGENVINYFFRKLAMGTDKPRQSFENFFTSTFGSDKDRTELQRQRGGESIIEQQDEILPSSYGANNMQSLPVFSKETIAEVQKIRNDKTLSKYEKDQQIKDIADDVLRNNKVNWVTNPKFGKTKNIGSLATLYGNANMLAGLSELALETVGLKGLGAGKFLSAGLPMYVMEEQNQFKEAVNKGIENPEGYAVVNALPMFLIASGVSQLDIAKRALGGTEAGKVLENMTEEQWANIASKNSRRISAIKNSLSKTLHTTSDLLVRFGVAPQVAQAFIKHGMFEDTRTVGDAIDESINNLGNSLIDSGALLLLTGATNYKEISPALKASVWNIAQHREGAIMDIHDQVAQGKLTKEVATDRIATINKIDQLVESLPTKNKKGGLLSDEQKMDLLTNRLISGKDFEKEEAKILEKSPAEYRTRPTRGNVRPPEPLTPEQELLKKALPEISGVYKAAAEDAVNDPEKAKQFLADAKDQINNQVASEAGNPSEAAKKAFGKTITDHVSATTQEPIKEETISPSTVLSRGDEIEQTYNERKKSIDEELNQQLEDNKDRLDDIEDKGGTKTVRQKIYKEHSDKMVELEKWKMGEDLKKEDTPEGRIKKNSEFSANSLTDAIPNSEVHYENKEDNGVTTITLRDKNSKKHIASIDIGTGDTINGYAGVRIQVNGEHQGKGLSKHLYNLALTEAKKQGLKGLYTIDEMLKTPDKTISTRDNFVTRKNTDEKLKSQARKKYTNIADPSITFIEDVSDKFIKKGAQSLSSNTPSKEQVTEVKDEKPTNEETEAKIQKLEAEREGKVREALKPELEIKFKTADDIKGMAKGNPKEFKRIAKEQGGIKKKFKQLESIIDCLWAKS